MSHFAEVHYYEVLAAFLVFVLASNVPFGYLRRGYRKYSRAWGRCIYIPIILNVLLRKAVGLTYMTIPLVVGAVLVGQFIGTRFLRQPQEE